jgi:hypothetical protein
MSQGEETAIARQWHDRHLAMVTNMHATVEGLLDAVLFMQSNPRLQVYNVHTS